MQKRAPRSSHDSIFDRLRLMQECPLCGDAYTAEQVAVLEQYAGSHLVHITCPRCHNAILAMVMVSSLGMSSVGIVTDLSAPDVTRMRQREPISEDDLLTFYSFLQGSRQLERLLISHDTL